MYSALRKPFRDQQQDVSSEACGVCDCPRDWGPAVIRLHYEPTLILFNATKFQMRVRSTVKVMVWKDFDVPEKPDFPLTCMKTLCSIAVRGWIFVHVGYNSRRTLKVMVMSGRICIWREKGVEIICKNSPWKSANTRPSICLQTCQLDFTSNDREILFADPANSFRLS